MNRGFYTILAAQFFSSLGDNALLFAAIAVRNFNENLCILSMLVAYALMIEAGFSVNAIVLAFGFSFPCPWQGLHGTTATTKIER